MRVNFRLPFSSCRISCAALRKGQEGWWYVFLQQVENLNTHVVLVGLRCGLCFCLLCVRQRLLGCFCACCAECHLTTFKQKVKVISRDPQDYAADKLGNGVKAQHNTKNTALHPFQLEREYVRALNSVKMDSIFIISIIYIHLTMTFF